jgi:hypothetical protein
MKTYWVRGGIAPSSLNLSLHHRDQNGSGAHPASYPMGTRGSFPGIKRPEREADRSPPSSAEVKECVELYLHSRNTLSWRGAPLKNTATLPLPFILNLGTRWKWVVSLMPRSLCSDTFCKLPINISLLRWTPQAVSSLEVFRLNLCTHFSFPYACYVAHPSHLAWCNNPM